MTTGNMSRTDKLAELREYERIHLDDIAEMAQRGDEILRELAKVKEERVKRYEKTIAERIELQDPMLDITDEKHIASYIKRKYREHGVQASLLAHMDGWIPAEHKTEEEQKQVIEVTADGSSQSSMDEYRKPIDRLNSKEMVERDEYIASELKKHRDMIKRLNDEQELLYGKAGETNLDLPSMKSAVISTPWAEEKENEWADLLIKIGNSFVSMGNDAKKVNLSPEDAARYVEAGKTWHYIVEHAGDVKHTKTVQGWLKTIRTFEDFGKHAAAVKEGIITINGVKRPLTREQVGDKAPEILEAAQKILGMEHLLAVIAEYHQKYVEPRIAQRKVDLSPKLSEQA